MDDDARAQILARAQARKPKRTRKPRRAKPSNNAPGSVPASTEAAPPAPARPAGFGRSRHAWDGQTSALQEEARKTVPVAGPGVGTGPPRPSTPATPPLAPAAAPPRSPPRPQASATPLPRAAPPDLPPLAPLPAATTTEGYWNDDFAVLHDFVATHGAAIPRSGQVWKERPVGRWVEQQRRRRDRLSAAQTQALESLPGWCWSSVDAVWEEHLRALEAWVDARGWLPPPTLRLDNGLRIGPWMEHQRRLHREDRLPTERAARLAALPAWTWRREG